MNRSAGFQYVDLTKVFFIEYIELIDEREIEKAYMKQV